MASTREQVDWSMREHHEKSRRAFKRRLKRALPWFDFSRWDCNVVSTGSARKDDIYLRVFGVAGDVGVDMPGATTAQRDKFKTWMATQDAGMAPRRKASELHCAQAVDVVGEQTRRSYMVTMIEGDIITLRPMGDITMLKCEGTMKDVQCRMARAALGWGVRDLAKHAGVAIDTVVRLERGETLRDRTVEAIKGALEKGGVAFLAENGGGAGVRLTKKKRR